MSPSGVTTANHLAPPNLRPSASSSLTPSDLISSFTSIHKSPPCFSPYWPPACGSNLPTHTFPVLRLGHDANLHSLTSVTLSPKHLQRSRPIMVTPKEKFPFISPICPSSCVHLSVSSLDSRPDCAPLCSTFSILLMHFTHYSPSDVFSKVSLFLNTSDSSSFLMLTPRDLAVPLGFLSCTWSLHCCARLTKESRKGTLEQCLQKM